MIYRDWKVILNNCINGVVNDDDDDETVET